MAAKLLASQLVMPLFVCPGLRVRAPIPAMPGQFRLSIDQLVKECRDLPALGVSAVLLFGLADRKKDALAKGAYAADGIVQRAIAAVKAAASRLTVISDVCLCAYTSHGHCCIVKKPFLFDHAATLDALAKVALSHAQAGADRVAPSDMMDGSVGAIRRMLDKNSFQQVPIMAYAAKFASALYAPFRSAVDSAPAFGDRRAYQLDPSDAGAALRKAKKDLALGADVIMVKPAFGYLDIVRLVKDTLRCQTAAFNVSGEYAMVKAAAERGWINEKNTWLEMLLCMRRAGADVLITYWAKEAARFLKSNG